MANRKSGIFIGRSALAAVPWFVLVCGGFWFIFFATIPDRIDHPIVHFFEIALGVHHSEPRAPRLLGWLPIILWWLPVVSIVTVMTAIVTETRRPLWMRRTLLTVSVVSAWLLSSILWAFMEGRSFFFYAPAAIGYVVGILVYLVLERLAFRTIPPAEGPFNKSEPSVQQFDSEITRPNGLQLQGAMKSAHSENSLTATSSDEFNPLWIWVTTAVLTSFLGTPAEPLSVLIALVYGLFSFGVGTVFGSQLHRLTRVLTLILWIVISFLLAESPSAFYFTLLLACYGTVSIVFGVCAWRRIQQGRPRILAWFSVGYVVGTVISPMVGTIAGAMLGAILARRSEGMSQALPGR